MFSITLFTLFFLTSSCSTSIRFTNTDIILESETKEIVNTDLENEEPIFDKIEDENLVLHSSGKASYYGNKFNGRKTASGERFHNTFLTAAHKKLPFGTIVVLENISNKRRVTVRINDRGPFTKNRILDVSLQAAIELDFVKQGTASIRIYIQKNK